MKRHFLLLCTVVQLVAVAESLLSPVPRPVASSGCRLDGAFAPLLASPLAVSSSQPSSAAVTTAATWPRKRLLRPTLHTMYSTGAAEVTAGSETSVINEGGAGLGAWIPIASASSLRGLGPQQITVMGMDFVVWESELESKKGGTTGTKGTAEDVWSVMHDACPHRMAPLSQGRVDPKTGCIECAYHGWQFDPCGKLASLPQIDDEKSLSDVKGGDARSLPVHMVGDLIFAFLPSSVHGESFPKSLLPEEMNPIIRRQKEANKPFYVRELPYSADFLIENFMDPAHIPFAHHSLQSTRDDGKPIPMETLVSNFTHVEVSFLDESGGRVREGVVSFQRPTLYHFRTKGDNNEYRTNLAMHVVPVGPGKSRVLMETFFGDKWWFPTCLSHASSNRFFNTDTWLHDAEWTARKSSSSGLPYIHASQSDRGVRAFRKWWAKYGFRDSPLGTFGAATRESLTTKLSRREQIDPWENHARQCASCRKSLAVMGKVYKGSLFVTAVGALLLRNYPVRAVLFAAVGAYFSNFVEKFRNVIRGNPDPSGYADRSPSAMAK